MKLSVVIPALDEAEHIEAAILAATGGAAARGALAAPPETAPSGPAPSAGPGAGPLTVEVIVVDGGSRDGTAERAAAAGARVIASPAGRARQLDAGARAGDGDVVLFLHADTRLPEGWAEAVVGALADDAVVGGAFRLRFDRRSALLRLIEWGVRLRLALFRLPYGDQALFVRRTELEALGGVPQVALMEDLDLVARMKRRGRLALLPQPVVTSARRYLAGGTLRTLARHWLAAAAWGLGVDRARVAQWVGR